MSDIKTRVKRVIHTQTGINLNEITDTATYEDLGLDSLDEIELVMALEEEFEIEILANVKFNSVQDIVNHIDGLGPKFPD